MLKYLLLGSIVLTQKEIKNLAYQCTERRFVLDFFLVLKMEARTAGAFKKYARTTVSKCMEIYGMAHAGNTVPKPSRISSHSGVHHELLGGQVAW